MKRVRVVNETAWRTADLRRFANAAYRRVFMPDEAKLVVVTFHRLRGRHMRGRATVGGWRVWLWLPDGPAAVIQKAALGSILCHELAHNAGVKNERTMRRSRALGWGPGWEQEHAWAEALPLERKPERQLPALTPEIGPVTGTCWRWPASSGGRAGWSAPRACCDSIGSGRSTTRRLAALAQRKEEAP